ncbi:MAG: hypothetical protein VX568_07765, partial [Actinomycetota bacterium]|nr:hypothetical protein [Actinomycetota bacterium]
MDIARVIEQTHIILKHAHKASIAQCAQIETQSTAEADAANDVTVHDSDCVNAESAQEEQPPAATPQSTINDNPASTLNKPLPSLCDCPNCDNTWDKQV